MERDAHYAAVGAATLALLLGLALFVVWLARFQFTEEYDVYDILFYGAVRGLQEGGEVHFNGIRVGEVTDLKLDRKTGNQVIARVRLEEDTPVRVDSRAQLEPLGITGVNYIQINAGTPGRPLLKSQYPDDLVPVIQSQPSPIAELLEGGGTLLARAVDSLNRINRVLSDDNIRSFSASVRSIETVTAELEARRGMLADAESALAEATAAISEFRQLAESTRGLVEGDGADALARIEGAATEAEGAARDVRAMVSRLEGPTSDFAATGLPQLTQAIVGLQETTESLNRLINEAQRSPQSLVSKPPAQEIEVEP